MSEENKSLSKKPLSIVIKKDATYPEVVDTISDVLRVGVIIESQLQDGFQWTDLFAALQVQPIVQEIVNDVPVFAKQFVDMIRDNPSKVKAAVLEAYRNTAATGPLGKVTNAIANALFALANSYEYGMVTYEAGQAQFLMWQALIEGGDIFPKPENPIM